LLKVYSLLLIVFSLNCFAEETLNTTPSAPTLEPAPESNTVKASTPISPYRADYEATWDAGWFPISIDAMRELKKDEDGWQLSFEAYSRVADISEVSNFTLHDYTIKPSAYHFKTSGFLTKSKRNMEVKWDEEKVYLPYKKKYADFDMPDNLQDSISYQEQIRLELMQGKTEFSYPISYKDRIKRLEFKVEKEETLNSKEGPIETILVKQTNTRHKKEFTRIWFAKDYEFLLVKLHMSDKHGDTTKIELEDAVLGGKQIRGF
jgi:hypothetical protein